MVYNTAGSNMRVLPVDLFKSRRTAKQLNRVKQNLLKFEQIAAGDRSAAVEVAYTDLAQHICRLLGLRDVSDMLAERREDRLIAAEQAMKPLYTRRKRSTPPAVIPPARAAAPAQPIVNQPVERVKRKYTRKIKTGENAVQVAE